MVVNQKRMRINLKRKISLFLFVVTVTSILFFNHSFYFGTIFIIFVATNELLHEKYKRERKKCYNKATNKLINELEGMITGVKNKNNDDDSNKTDNNRSEKVC